MELAPCGLHDAMSDVVVERRFVAEYEVGRNGHLRSVEDGLPHHFVGYANDGDYVFMCTAVHKFNLVEPLAIHSFAVKQGIAPGKLEPFRSEYWYSNHVLIHTPLLRFPKYGRLVSSCQFE